ncbi:MAG: agmatinase [Acholeplasmatales bacterium]|nr:MAG: agmatinase [Acholeplasmatales bacterium]
MSNRVNFIGCDATYEAAETVLIGVPFDGTTSFRPGTRFAPQVIRLESVGIETYSPYQDKDLTRQKIHDMGDVDVVFGNIERTLHAVKDAVQSVLKDGKRPFVIGGEHLISLPVIEAVYAQYPDLCVIQFDAHADLREDYEGEPLSHATVMYQVHRLLGDKRLFQFGIRSGTKHEFTYAKQHTIMERFHADTLEDILAQLGERPIYLTVDLDVLDPSIFPGTGTPEAGGWDFMTLHKALMQFQGKNLVGMDVVELSPHYDMSGVSTAVAVKVIREMLMHGSR